MDINNTPKKNPDSRLLGNPVRKLRKVYIVTGYVILGFWVIFSFILIPACDCGPGIGAFFIGALFLVAGLSINEFGQLSLIPALILIGLLYVPTAAYLLSNIFSMLSMSVPDIYVENGSGFYITLVPALLLTRLAWRASKVLKPNRMF